MSVLVPIFAGSRRRNIPPVTWLANVECRDTLSRPFCCTSLLCNSLRDLTACFAVRCEVGRLLFESCLKTGLQPRAAGFTRPAQRTAYSDSLCVSNQNLLLNLRISPMENFLAPFWMPTNEHSHFNSQQLLFSFVLSDLQALKHTSYQLLLPGFVWPADTPFQIINPDLFLKARC